MRLSSWGVIVTALLIEPWLDARLALAGDPAHELERELDNLALSSGVGVPPEGRKPPRAAIDDVITLSPDSFDRVMGPWGHHGNAEQAVVGVARDGKAAWITAELAFWDLCGMQHCMHDPPVARAHGTALFEPTPAGWQSVVWDFAHVLTAKQQAEAKRSLPAPIKHTLDAGVESAVGELTVRLARDPALLAAMVTDRKDAVLFGSDLAERFVGGAAIRERLVKWNLRYKIRDGVLAGLTTSGSVAWVVANVDAAKPGNKTSTTYRMFAILEKVAGNWQIVQLSFSIPPKAS
jgi:ketosteroid isomerase-like protein